MKAAVVPDGLAAMPAGPGLAAVLGALAPAQVPNDRILDVLVAQYRQLCHEQARMAAMLAELTRATVPSVPGRATRSTVPDRYAAAETRAALRWTRQAADAEHGFAESVVHTMPAVFEAWLAGVVDRARVRVFDQYLTGLSTDQVERICRIAVPRAPTMTTGQLAHLLRRMVIAVDPDAAARWYRKGVRDRDVTAYPAPDGTITISACGLPADEAEAACTRIGHLAAAAKRAGHPGLIGQIRTDLYLGLLDGRFHHMNTAQVIAALIADYRPAGPTGEAAAPPAGSARPRSDAAEAGQPAGGVARAGPDQDQRVGIEIRVGLATLLGRDEHPAEIPGLGLLIAPDARLRVALQTRAQWRFAVTDATGALLSEGITRHRPAGSGRDGPPGGIVELHVPAALLHELGADPGSCGAWAGVVADIAARHADRDRHLTDLDAHPADRLPGAALRRHTQIRDRTCTFAGVCRRPAYSTDIDHCVDHAAGGSTRRTNLGPLCSHDHHVKHRAGWTVTQPRPGTFLWHSPLGGHYPARGEFLLPELPEPAPGTPGPCPDRPARTVEGPILRRPPPPRAPRRSPGTAGPDEPPF